MTGFMFPGGKRASASNILLMGNLGFHRDAFRWGLHGPSCYPVPFQTRELGSVLNTDTQQDWPGKLRGNFREQPRMKKLKEPELNAARPAPSHYATGRSQEGILLISCPR